MTVVIELVVTSKGYKCAKSNSEWPVDLCGGVYPHLDAQKKSSCLEKDRKDIKAARGSIKKTTWTIWGVSTTVQEHPPLWLPWLVWSQNTYRQAGWLTHRIEKVSLYGRRQRGVLLELVFVYFRQNFKRRDINREADMQTCRQRDRQADRDRQNLYVTVNLSDSVLAIVYR